MTTNNAASYNLPRPNRARTRSPVQAKAVLSAALAKFGLDKDIARYQFVLHWPEIVGADAARRTRPECLRNGALVVRVGNSAWAQELSFQKETILRRLKNFITSEVQVDDVQFYVGDIRS